jgi:hypothetical protein
MVSIATILENPYNTMNPLQQAAEYPKNLPSLEGRGLEG